MIQFDKASINQLIVTVTENSTVANPIYLFLFKNQQSGTDYYFIATDISSFKSRYNKFLVTEKSNASTLNGEVEIGNEGFYDYEIYQTSLISTSGLTTALDAVQYITKIVETGLVWVAPTPTVNQTYSPQANTIIVYQP